jgi:NAD(P)-dependent dehydrogenase (short-subunit alcohol dehydrogenase family)
MAVKERGSLLDRFRLDGKVALVTGASSGLGRGFAYALAEAGADVVIAARRLDRLMALADEIQSVHGVRALPVQLDVTDPAACAEAVSATIAGLGRLDVLINNAGLGTAVPALRETPADFSRVVDANLHGTFWMAKAAAGVMEPGSSIVNIASVLGLVKSYAPQAAYASSKAGVVGLTRDLSQQWAGRRGIRVNAVAPGFFLSEMTEGEVEGKEFRKFFEGTCTLGRLGLQEELDAAVLFLASPAASYVTGTTIAVDGGMSGH